MLQWLPWEDAAEMAAATGVLWRATGGRRARWATMARPWARELTLILVLYGLWQCAGAWSLGQAADARSRGLWIWHLERGLHVLVEKPMTVTAAESERLVQVANERGLQLLVSCPWHYTAHAIEARRLIRSGALGSIRMISVLMTMHSSLNPTSNGIIQRDSRL